jgi:nucleoside-diphosphate-sugar epimerase
LEVLVTGGSGRIGRLVREGCSRGRNITSLDVAPSDDGTVAADIRKLDEIQRLSRGKEVVVHLAADPNVGASWESIHEKNIIGTYNVFEACRRSDVRRVVFASTVHVTWMYHSQPPYSYIVNGEYDKVDIGHLQMISHQTPPRPDSYYAVSKLFGENLGRYYTDTYGLSVVCLRFGWVPPGDKPPQPSPFFFASWLSRRDLVQLVERSIDAGDLKFDVFYGVSNNKWRFWDISHPREVLGYSPVDDAESFRSKGDV